MAAIGTRAPTTLPMAPNGRWSLDFASDQLTDGRRFRIFTVQRDGVASGSCVRVTPGIFTSEDDVDRLIAALKIVSRKGKLRA